MPNRAVQFRRGTTAEHSTFTGLLGEVTVDTDKDTLVVHDGATVGGFELARDSAFQAHITDTGNPHGVTVTQLGLVTELANLTSAEVSQLENINLEVITTTIWGYIGNMDQGLATTDSVTFGSLNVVGSITGTIAASNVTEISNLTAAEGAQLENIDTVTISNTQWGYLGNMNQGVSTSDTPTFDGTILTKKLSVNDTGRLIELRVMDDADEELIAVQNSLGQTPATMRVRNFADVGGVSPTADLYFEDWNLVDMIGFVVDSNTNLKGYGQTIEVETTTSRTLDANDAGITIEGNNASNITITVPPNSTTALPVGYTVTFVQIGAGQIIFSPGSGVTISALGGADRTTEQWAAATLYKRATDTWVLIGNIE